MMIDHIKSAAQRAQGTFLQDLAGCAALVVMLVVTLHLPGVL